MEPEVMAGEGLAPEVIGLGAAEVVTGDGLELDPAMATP
jgi:hypothetical protein